MTVSATTPYVKYACTGTTEYAYTFRIDAESELEVKRIATDGTTTTLTLTTNYSVDDNGDGSGGTITTVSTYSDGYLSIGRAIPYTQETEFTDGGPLPAETLEDTLDRIVMIVQQLKNIIDEGAMGINWRDGWATDTAYSILDMVTNDGKWYICTTAHTSDVFASDLGNAYWRLFLTEPSSHAISSHSDTTATGAELETLTDDSMADTKHRHSELSGSDGSPNPALSVDADGDVSLQSGTGINEFSIDGTFAGNSDDAVPTEKAVKTYVDNNGKFYDAYIRLSDQKTQNTDGGDFNNGAWRVRDIQDNADDSDTGSLASVSSNVITLAAGTYRCLIRCPVADVDLHQARLYDTTGTAVLLLGTVSKSSRGPSIIAGRFTLSVQSEIQIEHRCQTTQATNGFGEAANLSTEIYTIAEFWREA